MEPRRPVALKPLQSMPLLQAFLLLIFFVSTIAAPANVQDTPFYQGKRIQIIVGTTTGSLYDRWAHLLARAMSRNIPGPNPV